MTFTINHTQGHCLLCLIDNYSRFDWSPKVIILGNAVAVQFTIQRM